ncbi:zinc metalloproteinase nas-13-like isoform X2 [Zootermopsis nevadensis]|uniref:Metalloendopeptidase n=1 Tax=Zootermopsis nevadensis TaxID=136037 RepID=A0A067R7M5_ZOONE|nr:zinc metalloproteinase nas-13-like isoform X2 [Zootermopsis nevadensis]KDR19395.1 Zinc metalloproteinase nas-14 [Zootermopsis nevadensis]
MFCCVTFLVIAATCITGRVIDVRSKQSAWELSGKFEGDIVLTGDQLRNGLINPASRWPKRTLPFLIDEAAFTEEQKAHILHAVDEYHNKTSIRLREYDPEADNDYVYITGEKSGCWSYVGRTGGRQQLNLEPNEPGVGCFRLGTIEHELLHTLGFYHQQSATDRDDYVTIHWENIQPGTENNFNKYNASSITNFGVEYDYDSVLHYSAYSFSKNGEKTIEPKDENVEIGQRAGFSKKDIEKLSKMYEDV